LSSFNGKKVWALAGIGNPARFFSYLRQRGLDPAPVPLADHARADLGQIRERGDWPIVMTEKDAVKYPACSVADAWYVPVKLCMTAEAEAAVLSRIIAGLARHPGARSSAHA
jgi:tetraacyldisaccharide 4'-kinase